MTTIIKKNVHGSEMDPQQELARRLMLSEGESPLPEIVVMAPEKIGTVVPVEPESTGPKWWHYSKLKPFLYTQWFRYILLFLVTCILLLVISPPFVQTRRKNQTHLEKAPTSYKRILIVSALITGIVFITPICYEHKSKIASAVGVVKNWF